MTDYHALSTILIAISTTAAQTSRPQGGLGYASEPSTMTSALCLSKILIQEPEIHLLIEDNIQDRSHPAGHAAKGLGLASSPHYDNHGTLGFPP
jgi:hypothetical protein